MSAALFNLDSDGTLEILTSRENIKKIKQVTVTQPGRKVAKAFVQEKELEWHPSDELPPLHDASWTDEEGYHECKKSDWMFIVDESCDEWTGPIHPGYYVKSGKYAGWENGQGRCDNVSRWMPMYPVGF